MLRENIPPFRWLRVIPAMIVFLGLSLSLYSWYQVDKAVQRNSQLVFRSHAQEVVSKITSRLKDYEQILLGGVGLFVSSEEVNRREWRSYVSALKLDQNYPGILGMGYSQWLEPQEIEANQKKIQAEGFPEYLVHPVGNRKLYSSIVYLEPFNWRNQRAFGYDMYSEPIRKEAMDLAMNQGITSLSGKITLVQETEKDRQAGFLIYVPHYKRGLPLDTVSDRQKAKLGFVYSPIRANDFVLATLGQGEEKVGFRLLEGDQEKQENLLFATSNLSEAPSLMGFLPSESFSQSVQVFNRIWRFDVYNTANQQRSLQSWTALIILLAGSFMTMLLAWLFHNLVTTRQTAVRLAEKSTIELKELEAKWRSLSENSPDWIVSLDRNLVIENFNHPLPGHDPRDVLKAPILTYFPWEEKQKEIKKKMDQVLSTGIPQHFDHSIHGEKGQVGHYSSLISARFEGNRIAGLILRTTDTTAQKNINDELSATKERLELVIASSRIGVWDWQLTDNKVQFDAGYTRMLGFEPDEFPQEFQSWESRVHPDDMETVRQDIANHLEGRTSFYRNVHRLQHKKGHWLHVLASGKITGYDEQGKAVRFSGTHTDISAEKEALAKLDEANRTKDKFFDIIAHDLKSPFNGILGGTNLLVTMKEEIHDETALQMIDLVNASALAACELLEDLLAWARIQNNRIEVKPETINALDIVGDALDISQGRVLGKELKVEINIPQDLNILADRRMLQEVLLNLISNATKFSFRGGTIQLEGCSNEHEAILLIKDQGVGVSEEGQKAMFSLDTAFSTEGTEEEGGTGLGLTLCKEFMHKMGGDIRFDPSHQPGASFALSFPFQQPRMSA